MEKSTEKEKTRNGQKQQSKQSGNDYEQHLVLTEIGDNTVPIILFSADAITVKSSCSMRHLGEKYHLTFKLVHTECKVVKSLLIAYGFHEVHPSSPDFNVMWTNSHIKPGTLHSLTEYQKINHFPRSFELTRKDRLYKNIQQMQQTKGAKSFDFIPQSFLIPLEFAEFCSEFRKWRGLWIVKPLALSRGRGIFIISRPDELPSEEPVLVAKYIDNPLLINGNKFDLRLYVAVTSFDPLIIYLYREGLARFATEKYRKGVRHLGNHCMHLTNYSVNRYSSNYVRCFDPNVEDYGNKWSLSALLCYLQRRGCDTSTLMTQIKDIIVKALISAEYPISSACKLEVPNYGNCFELFGFDILLDDMLRPWLLEINFSPSLACDMPLDLKIKSKLVADLLTLTGIVAHDPLLLRFQQKRATTTVNGNASVRHKHQRLNSELSKTMGRGAKQQVFSEEMKILKMIQEEHKRGGEFVRIFPTANAWELYGEYFEDRPSYNIMIHKFLFPSVGKFVLSSMCKGKVFYRHFKAQEQRHQLLPKRFEQAKKFMSAALARALPSETLPKTNENALLNNKSSKCAATQSLNSCAVPESEGVEENVVIQLLKLDETLSQVQARRVFALYLFKVGQRLEVIMKNEPLEQDRQSAEHFRQQMELVFQFLNYASENLFTPISVTAPNKNLTILEQGKFLVSQLNKFLQVYNQETDRMSQSLGADDREYFVNKEIFNKFIESARASELEEVLMIISEHHSTSWFLGTRKRNSGLSGGPNWSDVTLGNLSNFQKFFPQKCQSTQDCSADLPYSYSPYKDQALPESSGYVSRETKNRTTHSSANSFTNVVTEPEYLVGELRRVKSSIYRAARIYTSKHTM